MESVPNTGIRPSAITAGQTSPYSDWQKAEGVPIYTGSSVADLHTLPVEPWARVGQKGALVSLGDQEFDDGWMVEIAPGGQTEVQHHMFEATIYVVEGRGATTIWQKGSDRKQTVEWQQGSLFSPPINSYYQHFNLDGQAPARLYAATTCPLMINILRNPNAVFNNDFVFTDRFDPSDDFFAKTGQSAGLRRWHTNLVPDLRTFKLDDWRERGTGSTNMFFSMSSNATSAHVSEFPVGSYKKAHRHMTGAHVIILGGVGYSLLWFNGEKEPRKVDWKEGTILTPKDNEYHQHFNTGATPARYLAFTFNRIVINNVNEIAMGADVSEKDGGWQIEYEDEDPRIWEFFGGECAKNGAEVVLARPNYRQPVGTR